MKARMVNSIEQVSYHRNGIGGVGFYAILFRADAEESSPKLSLRGKGSPAQSNARFLGIVYDDPGYCSVICLDLIDEYGVEFAEGNSWRGDMFEHELRKAIEESPSNRVGPFAI